MRLRNSYGWLHAAIGKIINSIGFIPSIMSFLAFGVGIFVVTAQGSFFKELFAMLPIIQIDNIETLRAILTSFLNGIISILIFSFSMLMIVLNQTASQYSPRILNWLIGKRSNQYILGTYLGTLIITLILLLSLPGDTDFQPVYNFGILLNSGLVFLCIILFVSIISNVSRDLQVSNITENIYKETLKRIGHEKTNASMEQLDLIKDSGWIAYPGTEHGYLQQIGQEELLRIAHEHDLMIKIPLITGKYYLAGDILFYLNRNGISADLADQIKSHFVFYQGERIQDNSYYGFKQLSEIAVKALSPGINDPRTANNCIDYLTDLFSVWMCKNDTRYIKDKKGKVRILIYPHTFQDLMDICLMPILVYGKKDINILQSLLVMLDKLAKKDEKRKYQKELNMFFNAVANEADRHKENTYFYNYLQEFKNKLHLHKDYFKIEK